MEHFSPIKSVLLVDSLQEFFKPHFKQPTAILTFVLLAGSADWPWGEVNPAQSEQSTCDPFKQVYACPNNCGRSYSWRRSLNRHLQLECGKERRYPCPYCPYRNTRKDNLAVHVNRRHADLIDPTGVRQCIEQNSQSSGHLMFSGPQAL